MTNTDWWKKSVVYQIYPRSFYDSNGDGIGDIPGIILKLDYIKKLGADVIWLCPVYDSPQVDNGYDIRNYYAIYKDYGTMEDMERLIRETHRRGMRLVMDLVVNHTSNQHPWFVESRKSKDNPYRDFYIWRKGKADGQPPTNWGSIFGGPAWEYDDTTGEYYLHLFAVEQPDLNWENDQVRKEVYQMMKFWLDKGIDGFRMDVINMLSKDQAYPDGKMGPGQLYGDGSPFYINGPRIHEFLREMNREVLSKYDIMTVGEMPGTSTREAKIYTNPANHELNMIFTFEHMDLDCRNGDKWDLKPLDLIGLKRVFEKWQTELYNTGWNSLYWNNHDQPRIVSRFGDEKEYREKSAKMLATCLHMMQGTPYIYQGEEIGMTNIRFEKLEDYRDIEIFHMYKEKRQLGWSHKKIMEAIHAKGRDNARTPMQWDDTDQAGFTTGTPWIRVNPVYKEINVKKALSDPESVFYYYQQLIRLRKELDIITTGRFELLLKDDPEIFAYKRIGKQQTLVVLCNFSARKVAVADEALVSAVRQADIVISNEKEHPDRRILRPYEAVVYLVRE